LLNKANQQVCDCYTLPSAAILWQHNSSTDIKKCHFIFNNKLNNVFFGNLLLKLLIIEQRFHFSPHLFISTLLLWEMRHWKSWI